jgi:iron complex transport system ATP-binding protein
VLLGANGSGKTTLLRILAGHAFPSDGALSVLGCLFGRCDLRELRKRIGWVHADVRYRIPPYMSALDVVVSSARGGLVLYSSPDAATTAGARERLAEVGVDHLRRQRFDTLSTGERQRVLIARALYARPELLLLDEPCIGLDPLARERFLEDLVTMLAATPRLTTLYVTHDVGEIGDGYDGVMILDRGRQIAAGAVEATLTEPNLRRVFGPRCVLERHDSRYSMRFSVDPTTRGER